MAEQDLQQPQVPVEATGAVGARLRQAREERGLSRADVAARTKIAERHLAAIEEDRFADLASSTYAVGFSRAYARAVGLDERAIAQAVRNELDLAEENDAQPAPTFEPGDPARVPSSRTAWLAGIGVAVVIAALLASWGSYYFPAVSLPDLTSDAPPPPPAKKAVATAAAPAATPPAQGPVAFTAREPNIWVKVTDGTGKQLFQKQMALGESFTVPADAVDPKLRTGRPDALAFTVGSRPVPPLSEKPTVMTASISATALLTRGTPVPSASASQQPAPSPTGAPAQAAPAVPPAVHASPVAQATPVPHAKPAAVVPAPAPAPAAAQPAEAPKPALAPQPAAAEAEPAKASTVSQ